MLRLTALSLLCLASPLGAQAGVAPATFQTGAERPAEVVARMARQAMGIPSDPQAWQALAEAIPDMALTGGADLEGTFEAARLADSLSALALAAGPVAEESEAAGPFGWDISLPLEQVDPVVALALAVAAMGALALVVFRRRTRSPETRPTEGRGLGEARSLVVRGLPACEIARRTGMAQDAVQVMLALSGAVPVPTRRTPPRQQTTRPTRRGTTPTVTREELEREARRAAAQLRDRRLTYGPGAQA